MPSKLQVYAQMADHAATQITGSWQEWTAFLTTAARLYKYPYNEQLMIFAQRPDATACAEFDLWNDKMRRYVRRGSKGIALIDDTGDRPRLRYVFDISDTGGKENARRPYLWELRQEHEDVVTEALERKFEVDAPNGLADQLERIAAQLAAEYWNDHQNDILHIVADSYLEEYDDFNIGVQFKNAATVSITYALLSRCGLEPESYFQHEDFMSIFDFNTPAAVAALGTAVSQSNQEVLRQIGITIQNYEREKFAERSATHGEQLNLQAERGLFDSRPSAERAADQASEQIRENEESISEGVSPGSLQSNAVVRETVSAPAGDRRGSAEPSGTDDSGTGESGRRDGRSESQRPDEVGGPDDQLQSAGGGNYSEGAYQQLTLDLFPSEAQQIQSIQEAESVHNAPFAFSVPQVEVDTVLRSGGNQNDTRLRIVSEYQKGRAYADIAEFLKTECKGGKGFLTDSGKLSVWYDEAGLRLSNGSSAQYVKTAQILSWEDAAKRIGELLEEGHFASNVELAEAEGYERSQIAQSLWYLYHDFSDKAKEAGYLPSLTGMKTNSFPTETAALSEQLQDAVFRSGFLDEYRQFLDAYKQDRDLLRFHYHRPTELLARLQELDWPRREFVSELMEVTEPKMFITEDEISEALSHGSNVEGAKGRIYTFFKEAHTTKEQIDFLKGEYGTGGRSHAVSGSPRSGEDHDGKGMKLSKGDCEDVRLSWAVVAKRISELIQKERYLTPEEQEKYAELQREYAGMGGIPTPKPRFGFPKPEVKEAEPVSEFQAYNDIKHDHPNDIVLYQVGDFFEMYGEDARNTVADLNLTLTTRNIPDVGRVDMCGVPAHQLEQYVEQLRKQYGVTIAGMEEPGGERKVYSLAPTQAESIQEVQPAPALRTEITQADIDAAIQAWNGDMASKHAVFRYMEQHGREKDTAAWLAHEYGSELDKPLRITLTGTDSEVSLPWPKVQRRIAQLIRTEQFYTQEEQDRFDDVDPTAVRESLEQGGNAEQMLEMAERIAAESEVESYHRFSVTMTSDAFPDPEDAYAVWDDIREEYYADSDGKVVTFSTEQEAETYLSALEKEVSDRESAEWLYVEQSKLESNTDEPIISTEPEKQTDEEFARENLIPEETVFEMDGRTFMVDRVNYESGTVNFQDITFANATGFPIFRTEPISRIRQHLEQEPVEQPAREQPSMGVSVPAENFHITDDHLGEGGPKAKFRRNMDAINLLKELEFEGRQATPEEQAVLSQYVGWGGLADAFDETKPAWAEEFKELYAALSPEEYAAARSSTLNAHYTSPTVIKAIYEAVGKMGFQTGNILEPSCGVGNFFGMLPEQMQNSRLYGVELDSITGRIAKQLYPKADITVAGFETTNRRDFYDLAIGNVPFGQYQVNDPAYNKLGFSIHNYFFAKSLNQVRPGGVVAFVTSRYMMDAKTPEVRKYLAQRAELLGAIRLPNNAFKANAGTEVVSDIIFLQKRDRPIDIEPDWVHLGKTEDGFAVNSYFVEHPEMVLGRAEQESTAHGMDYTVTPIESLELSDQLHDAVKYIRGTYQEAELPDLGDGEAVQKTLPADPNVKNYSYTVVDGDVYFRENSVMVRPDLNATAEARVKGMVALRDCVHELIDLQMDAYTSNGAITEKQAELNRLYDDFSAKYGLINDRGNRLAFADDSSYYLLCALEVLDDDGKLERKADMFTKRTIQPHQAVTEVDTAAEALAVSIAEKACVDMGYMSQLTGKTQEQLAEELTGVIFRLPEPVDVAGSPRYVTADEYLSGNVREKLRQAERALKVSNLFAPNVEALKAAQPKDLDASEIEVRLGATWIDKAYIRQFMYETFDTPRYLRGSIDVKYAAYTAEWQITGKSQIAYNNIAAYTTYGTDRANAYKILEDTLNLRDVRIYDTIEDADGKERRVLNAKETTLAAQKQQAIRDAFKDWIWRDPERRRALVAQYNEEMNSTRPREYDRSHIVFSGMNPEITLREHQKNAIAHVLYGGNTLLAHEVGAGKTFEMVAAAMESKRLGLCQKSIFVVPNHLTEQWASEFLRLYPSANILVTTKKDFETHNRKKFCARIATGDYDAVIIGHSQFERIPISQERQERLLQEQIWEITEGIAEVESSGGERFTVKQLERTKKGLEARLAKLQAEGRKDDVVTFEQLGVDRMFVDEAHNYKNLFLYTKMRNVAGLSTTDAQKSSDMFAKCRYMDEMTGSRGVVFATGTPVSNSMTELYTMQRYLQFERLKELNMVHFDCWASRFGETATALELAPEGTGYRARTRFSKFFNLPELMNLFKEVADIKTADQLHLPTPEVEYHNVVAQPTEHQKEMVQALSERAAEVHSGSVDPSVDNMLKITSDGRKLGLDQRIINPLLPDEGGTKVNQCVDNIMQIWRDGQAEKLTQLVFCDISTPRATPAKRVAKAVSGNLDNPELHALETAISVPEQEPAFTVYEDIRAKLIAQGVPSSEIAFIHEANTEVRKKELFARVRSGQVRVLMGSTSKMGAGTNVQDRLVALHDLDCPWRPGDLAQRKGRIERQGNQNPLVHVFRYVTEGTFDAYLWQTVENKQKFISQIMTSKSPVRSCDDVDETALSFAEIKALCAGDPRIKERMDLDVEVSRLKLMKADHQSKQFRLEDNLLTYFPEKIEQNKGFIKGLEADMQTLEAHPHPKDGFAGMEVRGDVLTDKENAGAALLDACKEVKGTEPVQIGSYRGFAMSVTFSAIQKEYELVLRGEMTHRVTLGMDARGNLTRIDNALAQMPERLTNVQAQLENLYQQQAAARDEVGKPFPFEDELKTKTARLVELDGLLNMDGRKPQTERAIAKSARPSVLENLRRPVPARTDKKTTHHEEVR